jgi:two-component system phosphate regulon sensor histidine kinase PhoR
MNLHIIPLDLKDALESTLAVIQPRAFEKGIAILKKIPEGISQLKADRDKVSQVLLNVLDNAVKFTPDGGQVTIDASHEGAEFVRVGISDTGIGIPKSEIPRLGERFYRVDKSRSREVGGTGLGLSIVKHLMHSHGGYMTIDSTLGHGTRVDLFFPLFNSEAK